MGEPESENGRVSRRDFLRGFLRRADETKPPEPSPEPDVAPPATAHSLENPLIQSYLLILKRFADLVPWGVPATDLPAPIEDLKAALIACVTSETPRGVRDQLRDAYFSLPWFTTPEDVERLRAGKRVLESQDWSPEGKAAYIAAHARRQEILQQAARFRREFDAAVPPWVPPAPPEADPAAAAPSERADPPTSSEEPRPR
jgi:hypothetical protein